MNLAWDIASSVSTLQCHWLDRILSSMKNSLQATAAGFNTSTHYLLLLLSLIYSGCMDDEFDLAVEAAAP